MSGWLDPLGLNRLRGFLRKEDGRIEVLIWNIQHDARIGAERKRRRLAKCRAGLYEIRRIGMALNDLARPGIELQPHKALVNMQGNARRVAVDSVIDHLTNWTRAI